ncbi:cupin domain-containing protein [Chryseolinea sp. T2]|uniref:cupin domain-containing protein n=1 Tax=Chryseolinea sp. T2 TaxID=3129255 RepID=UPI0030788028
MRFLTAAVLLGLLFVINNLYAQHHGSGTSAAKITDRIILQQILDEPALEGKEVQMVIVDFPPGIVSGPHRHPCQTFGYLLEGELESEFEGKKYSYKKGDSFYEFPNGLHSLTKNPSQTETAKLLVLFILDKGQDTSVREKTK